MIQLKNYIGNKNLDLYRYYIVEGNFYYVENNRYKNGILQEPVTIEFKQMKINLAHGIFKDKDGNDYTILLKNIYDNEDEAKDRYLQEMKNYKNRITKKSMYDWYDFEYFKKSYTERELFQLVVKSINQDSK